MKTGGGSLNERLAAGFGPAQMFPRFDATHDGTIDQKMSVDGYFALGDRRLDYRFHTVHMPAAVAGLVPEFRKATMLREPVARSISHLRQLQKILGQDELGLDELYDRFEIRPSLGNYQARVLAAEIADVKKFMADQAKRYQTPGEDDMIPLIVQMGVSAIPQMDEPGMLERAAARLRSFDYVGVTERLGAFQRHLEQVYSWEEREVRHEKHTRDGEPVSDWLKGRLQADNQIDLELFSLARDELAR